MRRLLSIFLVLFVLGESACSPGYLPEQGVVTEKGSEEAELLDSAYAAWMILADKKQQASWPEATTAYNQAIRRLLDKALEGANKKGQVPNDLPALPLRTGISGQDTYSELIPSDKVDVDSYLDERVSIDGLGIPCVGVRPLPAKSAQVPIEARGEVQTLTAVLEFKGKQKPAWRLIPRIENEQINVGSQAHLLSADFSAGISSFWERKEIAKSAILGAFRPKETSDYMGLYFSEPYQSGKIPVLFTHGLMSSPSTFANLTNRLMVDPVIRHHFQFWYFGYPTGNTWVMSAKDQRDALATVMASVPKNSPASSLIMVGHSMGGLITRLNNSEHPWAMTHQIVKNTAGIGRMSEAEASRYIEKILKPSKALEKSKNAFFFTPIPETKRIVFMATPHQGSDFANTWIGILGQRLIALPQALVQEVINLGTMNGDMLLLNPGRLELEFTSIRQLSPDSPFIRGLQEVRPNAKIPVHSIIGDRGRNNSPKSSDGIVDYESSHLDWSTSECIVPASHSVQDDEKTALEMRRILRLHLLENKIPMSAEDKMGIPCKWEKVRGIDVPSTRSH